MFSLQVGKYSEILYVRYRKSHVTYMQRNRQAYIQNKHKINTYTQTETQTQGQIHKTALLRQEYDSDSCGKDIRNMMQRIQVWTRYWLNDSKRKVFLFLSLMQQQSIGGKSELITNSCNQCSQYREMGVRETKKNRSVWISQPAVYSGRQTVSVSNKLKDTTNT